MADIGVSQPASATGEVLITVFDAASERLLFQAFCPKPSRDRQSAEIKAHVLLPRSRKERSRALLGHGLCSLDTRCDIVILPQQVLEVS